MRAGDLPGCVESTDRVQHKELRVELGGGVAPILGEEQPLPPVLLPRLGLRS